MSVRNKAVQRILMSRRTVFLRSDRGSILTSSVWKESNLPLERVCPPASSREEWCRRPPVALPNVEDISRSLGRADEPISARLFSDVTFMTSVIGVIIRWRHFSKVFGWLGRRMTSHILYAYWRGNDDVLDLWVVWLVEFFNRLFFPVRTLCRRNSTRRMLFLYLQTISYLFSSINASHYLAHNALLFPCN